MSLYLSLTKNPCEGFQLRSDSILFVNSEARRRLGGDLKARPLAFLDLVRVAIEIVGDDLVFSSFDQGGRRRRRCCGHRCRRSCWRACEKLSAIEAVVGAIAPS